MKSEKITFKNKKGEELSGRLELPADQLPHNFAIFAHCFTCSKNLKAINNISRSLTGQGIAVFRFDFTGLGESKGDFSDTNFSTNIQDLVAASDYLTAHHQSPSLLVGHSLGGAAVMVAAHQLPTVQAVATIGAPATAEHVKHLVEGNRDEIVKEGKAKVNIGGRGFTIKKQFIDDLEEFTDKGHIKSLKKAVLILHSPQDMTVGIEQAAEIYQAAKHPKSFITLDGADHLMSKAEDSLYVGQMIASWASRYLEQHPPVKLESDKAVVVRIGEDDYTTDVLMGRHGLVADEPEEVGGNDFGPSPLDLLMASLGTCTAMTLRMYAGRKGWDLQEVKVHLTHQKVDREVNGRNTKIDHFERLLELSGKLDKEQYKRLIEIANKCPIHKTLHGPVEVDTKLKDLSGQ